MKYDFETVLDRSGNDALALDTVQMEGAEVKEGFSKIPMWIADMCFATVPSVNRAIAKRMEHPIYGYYAPRNEYYEAIIDWQKNHNSVFGLTPENIGYENGVLGGVACALAVLSSPGENILVHSPTYCGFTSVLQNNGYNIIHSPLYLDETGVFRMDFNDMDRKIKQYGVTTAIFCSPHNPSGRVWEKWEIEKAMEVYKKNGVFVISDEIWSDLTLYNNHHIPTQSVSEDSKNRTISFYAPSKTFNLAGLIGSYHIIYNKKLKEKMDKQSSLSHYNSMNVLSQYALIGAYSKEGEEWLCELRKVLEKNIDYALDYIKENFEGIKVSRPQGTYLLYLDLTDWCKEHSVSIEEITKRGIEVGVLWQEGCRFGGDCHIRMNIALPHSLVKEAFGRLSEYVFNK
jgi:cystathionine beta-lyase